MSDVADRQSPPLVGRPPDGLSVGHGGKRFPVPDGCFSSEWARETYRVSYGVGMGFSRAAAGLVERHGLDNALHGDIIELDDLDHSGPIWQKRRHVRLRAQRHLRKFHGLPEVPE